MQWRRIAVVSFAVLLAVGACGGSASTAVPSAAPSAAQPSPAATAAADDASPSVEAGDDSGAVGSGVIGIPAKVGSVTYSTTVFTKEQVAAFLPWKSSDFENLLTDAGKTVADCTLATAGPSDATYPIVYGFKTPGVMASQVAATLQSGSLAASWETATMGGKTVVMVSETDMTRVLYAKDDVLYWLSGPNKANVETVVAALP